MPTEPWLIGALAGLCVIVLLRVLRYRTGLGGKRGASGAWGGSPPEEPTGASTAGETTGKKAWESAGKEAWESSGEGSTEADPESVEPLPRTDASDTVVCQGCGVTNGAEYRFCRACVSELPGTGFALEPTSDANPRPF